MHRDEPQHGAEVRAPLEEKRLIDTEKTTVQGRDGRVKNGVLLYTIRPIHEAVAYRMEQDRVG